MERTLTELERQIEAIKKAATNLLKQISYTENYIDDVKNNYQNLMK